jgi:hypothetical protein
MNVCTANGCVMENWILEIVSAGAFNGPKIFRRQICLKIQAISCRFFLSSVQHLCTEEVNAIKIHQGHGNLRVRQYL